MSAPKKKPRVRKGPRKPSKAAPRIDPELTPQQSLFAREYLKDLDGKAAAVRAGYSAKTAESQASRLLRHVKIRALLADLGKKAQEALAREAEAVELSVARVLKELAVIGFSDLRQLLDADGKLKPVSEWPDAAALAIGSIEVVKETVRNGEEVSTHEQTIKVKTWDKPRALEMLGRYLKMFTDRKEISGELTVTEKQADYEDLAARMTDEELEEQRKLLARRDELLEAARARAAGGGKTAGAKKGRAA